MLAASRERTTHFKAYVANQARAQAFKMAVLCYNTFEDNDPELTAQYKDTMNNIIKNQTDGDSDTEMLALDGNEEQA